MGSVTGRWYLSNYERLFYFRESFKKHKTNFYTLLQKNDMRGHCCSPMWQNKAQMFILKEIIILFYFLNKIFVLNNILI